MQVTLKQIHALLKLEFVSFFVFSSFSGECTRCVHSISHASCQCLWVFEWVLLFRRRFTGSECILSKFRCRWSFWFHLIFLSSLSSPTTWARTKTCSCSSTYSYKNPQISTVHRVLQIRCSSEDTLRMLYCTQDYSVFALWISGIPSELTYRTHFTVDPFSVQGPV